MLPDDKTLKPLDLIGAYVADSSVGKAQSSVTEGHLPHPEIAVDQQAHLRAQKAARPPNGATPPAEAHQHALRYAEVPSLVAIKEKETNARNYYDALVQGDANAALFKETEPASLLANRAGRLILRVREITLTDKNMLGADEYLLYVSKQLSDLSKTLAFIEANDAAKEPKQ